jgi:hypothetical protein
METEFIDAVVLNVVKTQLNIPTDMKIGGLKNYRSFAQTAE